MTLLTITCAAACSWFADGVWEGAPCPGGLALFQQWPFFSGQHQGCHPPFAVPVFPKVKRVQASVRSWGHPSAPVWTLLWPWQKQLKALTASMFHCGFLTEEEEAKMAGGGQIPPCQQNLMPYDPVI